MRLKEDPRVKVAKKCLALAWIYFFIYIGVMMALSYFLGIKPYIWGLPRWVALGCVAVPLVFVILLIFVVERFIPDIPLTDEESAQEERQ